MTLLPIVCSANVENGSDQVEVTGTDASTGLGVLLTDINCRPNATVFLAGVGYLVKARIDTTHLQIERNYEGADGSGVSCSIAPFTPEMANRAELATSLRTYSARDALLKARGNGLHYVSLGATGAADPGPGKVSYVGASWAAATALCIDVIDAAGRNRAGMIDRWGAGDTLTVESISTSAYVAYELTQAPTNEGPDAWRKLLEFALVSSDGAIVDEEDTRLVWTPAGTPGPGYQVDAEVDDIAGRAAHDAEAEGFKVFVHDVGDGRAAVYRRQGATGNWVLVAYYTGPQGDQGDKGWAPQLVAEADGERTVLKLAGYVGGEGTAPTANVGQWLKPDGTFTATVAEARDVTGASFKWRTGGYSGATAYAKRDVIRDQGASWIALQPTTGNAPPTLPATSNAYWELMVAPGANGAGTVAAIIAGSGIVVNNADPTQPVISASVDLSAINNQITDISRRQMQAMLELADLKGDRLGFKDGIADPFDDESDVDTGTVVSSGTAAGTSDFSSSGGYTLIDMAAAIPNSVTVSRIGINQNAATTFQVKIVKRNSAGNFDVVYSEAFAHPGGGFVDKTLTTPYAVPGTGTYYVGLYTNSTAMQLRGAAVARAYKATDIAVGSGITGFTEDSNINCPPTRFAHSSPSQNQSYNSATGRYSPASRLISAATGTPTGNLTAPSAAFDGNIGVWNSGTYAADIGTDGHVGKDWGVGVTKTVVQAIAYGPSDVEMVRSGGGSNTPTSVTAVLEGSNDNSSWVTLASAATGTALGAVVTFSPTSRVGYRYHRVRLPHPGSAADYYITEVRFFEAANVTLVSKAFAAAAAPATARLALQAIANEAITLNTDLKGSVSRDNGATWTQATLALDPGSGLYVADNIDLSAQPSGTAMRWKTANENNKNIDHSGVVMQWRQ